MGSTLLAILLIGLIPYMIVSSPHAIHLEKTIEAPAEVVFASIEDVRNWPAWAWPWTEDPDAEVMWYDKTTGEMAGFFWNSSSEKINSGVVELRNVNPPKDIQCVVVPEAEEPYPLDIKITLITDSTSKVELIRSLPAGNLPWERIRFWSDLPKLKKDQKKQLDGLAAFLTTETDSITQ